MKSLSNTKTADNVADRTTGPLLVPLIAFSIPLMMTNMLQLLFNAVDIIVVGQFASANSVAAVGATSSIINLLVTLFSGISIGVTVVIATELGSGNSETSLTVHTSYAFGILLGIFTAIIGFFVSKPLLHLMGTPNEIIEQAALYLKIVFIGQPGFMIYTFARAILISTGDTKSPLKYLIVSGIINTILNLILVIGFQLDVAGVAIATSVSHFVSAVLTTRKLCKLSGDFHLNFTKIRIHGSKAIKILRLGLPTGIQSAIFSVSNIMIQGAINSLGTVVVAGYSAAQNIQNFAFQALAAFSQGALTFAGQNYGARKYDRIRKVFRNTLLCQSALGIFFAFLSIVGSKTLLHIYLPDAPDSVEAGIVALHIMLIFVFLGGFQECSSNILRGMNRSLLPMVVTIFGTCVLRIIWVMTVFQWAFASFDTHTAFRWLLFSYPITWTITLLINLTIYFYVIGKLQNAANIKIEI